MFGVAAWLVVVVVVEVVVVVVVDVGLLKEGMGCLRTASGSAPCAA